MRGGLALSSALPVAISPRSGGGAAAFTPASLSPTAWYDPSDISTLFQDSAGTTPVTASGDPVGKMLDKSGNGNHLLQATAGKRPLYNVAGAIKSLVFDGVDDFLQASFTLSQPFTRISAFKTVWGNSQKLFDGSATLSAQLFQGFGANNAILYAGGVGPIVNIPDANYQVMTENFNGATSRIARNNAAYDTSGDPGAAVPAGITVGSGGNGTEASQLTLGRLILVARTLTDPETANARTWAGAGSGLTL